MGRRTALLPALLLALSGGGPESALAEQLPLARFTTAQGLPHDRVNKIVADSRGYLWFCTAGGLSRFDGHSFTTYGPEHGLAASGVQDLIESRHGLYWVASWGGGVYSFDPDGTDPARLFRQYPVGDSPMTSRVHVLLEDRSGRLWAGTIGGLFVSERADGEAGFHRVDLTEASRDNPAPRILALLEDRGGALWIGGVAGLLRRTADGRVDSIPLAPDHRPVVVFSVLEDRQGRLWVAHEGLTVLMPGAAPGDGGAPASWRLLPASWPPVPGAAVDLPRREGEARAFVPKAAARPSSPSALLESSDGQIWIGTYKDQLLRFDGMSFRIYTAQHGLGEELVALAEDREGHLWIGSNVNGALRLTRGGFTAYGRADGLDYEGHGVIVESRRGEIAVFAEGRLFVYQKSRFRPVAPVLDSRTPIRAGDLQQRVLADREGGWWFGTPRGLYRFAPVDRLEDLDGARPAAVYTRKDGLPDGPIACLFEDSRGDVWIGLKGEEGLARWDRSTGAFHRYGDRDGLPAWRWPMSIVEDAAGDLWIGLWGGLARLRNGRFQLFGAGQGVPDANVAMLHVDTAGRLWIARGGVGALRVDEPTADQPAFHVYTRADGLMSDDAKCITEDPSGRIYVGSVSGLDRLDPGTGRMRHFSVADGLSNNEIDWSHRDRAGTLWFTARRGVSRLAPALDPPGASPPLVWIAGIRIAGDRYPLPELGQGTVEGLRVPHGRNRIQIDFGGVAFGLGGALLFQYLMRGADQEEWSQPATLRSVHFASLSPGRYRFLVRAVDAEGGTASEPASVSFEVLSPFWRTWWFLSAAAASLGAAIFAVHRNRVARAVALERVRMRIATDLHDDVGSSLSQIAILSEVARQRLRGDGGEAGEPLSRIAAISRELIDNMSDIVWAIDPRRDRLADLVARMRRFASDIFTARGIRFRLEPPEGAAETSLGADVRRQVYLIFKESLHNAVRHSGCSEADIRLEMAGHCMTLTVRDDGAGFDPSRGRDGHGLDGMERRASSLGGTLKVRSAPGQGTTITLALPLRPRRRRTRGSPPDQVGAAARDGGNVTGRPPWTS